MGIGESDISFDQDIIIHINTVFFILDQLGVNSGSKFSIDDKEALWSEYLTADQSLSIIKTYMYLKVRLIFDPPLSGSLVEVMKAQIAEYEFRIMIYVDPKLEIEEVSTYE